MRVISVPLRLKSAVATLFLSVPLIALEVMIVTRSPWWKLPYRNMGYWSLTYFLVCLFAGFLIFRAKKAVFSFLIAFASVWISLSALTFVRMKYPPVGFFILFLLGFLSLTVFWIKYEMERSFFDPQLAWYQGLPRSIPGLNCRILSGDEELEVRVSRFDLDGTFVFCSPSPRRSKAKLSSLLSEEKLDMIFRFRENELTCRGTPALSIGKGIGAGIQFHEISEDQKKDIGDFVELLRGEGYV